MPTNTLNDAQCRSGKPTARARKLFDGGGLRLFISPTGSKTWRLAYRFESKPRTLSFGPYPEVSLSAARAKRDAAKAALRDGLDPMAVKRPTERKSISLAAGSKQYWDGRKDISSGYVDNAKRGIELRLCLTLGGQSMREVSRDDLLAALNVMDASSRHVYVRKVWMWVSTSQDHPCSTGSDMSIFWRS